MLNPNVKHEINARVKPNGFIDSNMTLESRIQISEIEDTIHPKPTFL